MPDILQNLTDLKLGVVINWSDAPYKIVEASFMRKSQGKPNMRTKLKNLLDGRVIEQTFKSGDRVERADLSRGKASFLYVENDQCVFMDSESYDQFSLPLTQLEHEVQFMTEGLDVDVMNYNGKPVTIELPMKLTLTVTETTDAVRGDTAQGAVLKEAKVETGASIRVPAFVKNGDVIRVNTETGEYVERA